MLPSFATVEQLGVRLPVALEDEDRAQAALDDASACVRAEAGKTWTTEADELEADIPDIVVVATLRLAARAYSNPRGVSQEGIDTFQVTWGDGDDYWRNQVKLAAGLSGLSSLKLGSPMPNHRRGTDIEELLDEWNLAGEFE